MTKAKPKQIRTNHEFMGSVFGNGECETMLRNIVLQQKAADPDEWTLFSWEDYKRFCTHKVSPKEKVVLDCFVNGGQPIAGSSACLDSGWLYFDGECYMFTAKMIDMLTKKYSI